MYYLHTSCYHHVKYLHSSFTIIFPYNTYLLTIVYWLYRYRNMYIHHSYIMYVHIHIHIHMYVYILCMYTFKYTFVYTFICMYILCMYTFMCEPLHVTLALVQV